MLKHSSRTGTMHDIESIIERLRANDATAVRDLLREKAGFIYKFPKIRRKEWIVEGGEFYEYAASKLSDGIRLRSFDPAKGNFNIWFTKVLDNLLRELVSKKSGQSKSFDTVNVDEELRDPDGLSHLEYLSFEEEKRNCRKIFSSLNDTEKAVALCHILFYKEIDPWELYFLSEFTGKGIARLSREIEELLTGELLDEEARIRRESEKIGSLYHDILSLESELAECRFLLDRYTTDNSRYKKTRKELRRMAGHLEFALWKKRLKYIRLTQIHRRGKGLVMLKGRKIAELLNVKEGTVTSAIARVRRKFKKKI